MVTSSLKGGLGNQMFQYAMGRALSLRQKTKFFLDLSWYCSSRVDAPRSFGLNIFKIKGFVIPWYVGIFLFYERRLPYYYITFARFQTIFQKFIKLTHYTDLDYISNQNLDETKNYYLEGDWQSEQYFQNFNEVIRDDFQFKEKPHFSVLPWIEEIKKTRAVSLHIRRGDYANNPKTKAFHGLLPLSYYEEAMNYIGKRFKTPTFFVFSDDLAWAKKNLKTDYPMEFVMHKGKDYEDMRLMSICRHHIIANSSFSWWGAWLNPAKDKMVIAPKKWFANTSKESSEIIPRSWIRL